MNKLNKIVSIWIINIKYYLIVLYWKTVMCFLKKVEIKYFVKICSLKNLFFYKSTFYLFIDFSNIQSVTV